MILIPIGLGYAVSFPPVICAANHTCSVVETDSAKASLNSPSLLYNYIWWKFVEHYRDRCVNRYSTIFTASMIKTICWNNLSHDIICVTVEKRFAECLCHSVRIIIIGSNTM